MDMPSPFVGLSLVLHCIATATTRASCSSTRPVKEHKKNSIANRLESLRQEHKRMDCSSSLIQERFLVELESTMSCHAMPCPPRYLMSYQLAHQKQSVFYKVPFLSLMVFAEQTRSSRRHAAQGDTQLRATRSSGRHAAQGDTQLRATRSSGRHADQGTHRSNTRARDAIHSLDTKHRRNTIGTANSDGLMLHGLQKTCLCVRSVVVLLEDAGKYASRDKTSLPTSNENQNTKTS